LNFQFYDAIVPQFIPFPRLVHQITGALEIIIPLFLITRFRQEAALIMIVFLILIYGANLYVWVNNLPYGRTYFSNQQHFIRLLLQILYIYITYVIYMYDK
jgi:Predicted membrane protein